MNMLGTPEREKPMRRPATKPHLTYAFGEWVCYSMPPAGGLGYWLIAQYGETPKIAADRWKVVRDQVMAGAADALADAQRMGY